MLSHNDNIDLNPFFVKDTLTVIISYLSFPEFMLLKQVSKNLKLTVEKIVDKPIDPLHFINNLFTNDITNTDILYFRMTKPYKMLQAKFDHHLEITTYEKICYALTTDNLLLAHLKYDLYEVFQIAQEDSALNPALKKSLKIMGYALVCEYWMRRNGRNDYDLYSNFVLLNHELQQRKSLYYLNFRGLTRFLKVEWNEKCYSTIKTFNPY